MSVEACVLDERVGLRTLADELGGELQSVHHDAGLSLVDAGFAESVAHLRDGAPDAFGTFEGGELKPLVGVFGPVESYMDLLVVEAVSHTAERRAMAAPSPRHDVAASFDLEHADLQGGGYPLPPSLAKNPVCNGL